MLIECTSSLPREAGGNRLYKLRGTSIPVMISAMPDHSAHPYKSCPIIAFGTKRWDPFHPLRSTL